MEGLNTDQRGLDGGRRALVGENKNIVSNKLGTITSLQWNHRNSIRTRKLV